MHSRNPSRSCPRSHRPAVQLLFLLLGLGLLNFWPLSAEAQPPMVTILTNGPAANRLNVVVLAEGYTSNQLGQFLVDATNTLSALLAEPPYQEYRNYFNTFATPVASVNSGSSHYGVPNNTYFNSSYDTNDDFLITIPPNEMDTNYSHGQGRVDALLQSNLPNCQLPVLLVNDSVNGGSDGSGSTAIASASPGAAVFAIHESGHVLANLGDEYTSEFPGYPNTEEPNTTMQTNLSQIKWRAWIDTNSTPVPTPPTASYADAVGLFEGAHYHTNGWYRPQLNCAMGNFSSPFCAVCREALVLALYQRVRPVDDFSPALTSYSASSTQMLAFAVNVLQPATYSLTIQWFTNAVPLAGATNLSFNIAASLLGGGVQQISARVRDETPLVRNDPDGRLTQTVTWSVNVGAVSLSLDNPTRLPNGAFSFRVTGNAPQGFVLQSSADLVNWSPLTTNALVAGQFIYTNAAGSGFSAQFFRARALP